MERVAWRQHCQGDTRSYTADCFRRNSEVAPEEISEVAADAAGASGGQSEAVAPLPPSYLYQIFTGIVIPFGSI